MKGIVSFDVTTRFNPNQKSIAIYNSHIFNDHNTTIKDQLTHSKYTEVFFYYPCVRQYFTLITYTVKVPIVIYLNLVTITKSHVLSTYIA